MLLSKEHRQDERPFAEELAQLHESAVQLLDALAEGSRGRNGADERLLGREEFDTEGESIYCLVTSGDTAQGKVADLYAEECWSAALAKKVLTVAANIGR